jgi:hypothetical protein
MKNIHLLPTDKPSRLGLNNKVLDYAPLFGFELFDKNKNFRHNPVNIYITSDEEIRRGDYFISLNGDESYLDIILNNEVDDFNEYADVDWIENCKKIIITDNKDLIKDGVQAIDDEFLEWFVKNANESGVPFDICEVEDYVILPFGLPRYKLLIPQEEDEQDDSGVHLRHCYQGEYKDSCKYGEDDCPTKPLEDPKQVTLEEAAKEYDRKSTRYGAKNIFKDGAKWQADRMYSEEEVLKLLRKCHFVEQNIEEWFEQHKKK